MLCFAIDDRPVRTWTIADVCPLDFKAAVVSGATVVAHNYLFEFNLYHHKLVPLGWPPIPLAQWSCTMARSFVAGYPGSLELAAGGEAGDPQGPRRAGSHAALRAAAHHRPAITWWHETSPEHFARLCTYCVPDVDAERLLDRAVPELSPRERAIFEVDHAINQRGLGSTRSWSTGCARWRPRPGARSPRSCCG